MRIAGLHATPTYRAHPGPPAMLGASHKVEPHAGGERQVALAQRVSVQEGGAFLPVLRRGIDLDNQRVKAVPTEQGAGLARDRVGKGGMRKREPVFRKGMILVLCTGAVGLPKGKVGKYLANARDVGEHAVKHPPPGFVLVETRGGMGAQIATALRVAKGQHSVDPHLCLARARGLALPTVSCVA